MKILWGGMQGLGTVPILRGLGVVKPGREEVRLTLRSEEGKTFERVLGSVPAHQNRKLVPPPDVMAPLFVRDVRRAHWIEALPESDAVYVQVNQIAPDPGETMPEFGLKLRKSLADAPVRNVTTCATTTGGTRPRTSSSPHARRTHAQGGKPPLRGHRSRGVFGDVESHHGPGAARDTHLRGRAEQRDRQSGWR